MRLTIKIILLLLSLSTILLAEAWFLKGYYKGIFEYEPLIVFITSLVGLITLLIKFHTGTEVNVPSHDQLLFKKFKKLLPCGPTIRFLRTDFNGSFRVDEIQPLKDFACNWDSSEYEFMNPNIEKAKKKLFKLANNLLNLLMEKTSLVRPKGFSSTLPDRLKNGERPQFVIDDAKKLNEEAEKFVIEYENFSRLCKHNLIRR